MIGSRLDLSEDRPTASTRRLDLNGPSIRRDAIDACTSSRRQIETEHFRRHRLPNVADKLSVKGEGEPWNSIVVADSITSLDEFVNHGW